MKKNTNKATATKQVHGLERMIGQKMLLRCNMSGTIAGTVVAIVNGVVELKDSRRLWEWKQNETIGIAVAGIKQGSRVSAVAPWHLLQASDIVDAYPLSGEALKTIDDHSPWVL